MLEGIGRLIPPEIDLEIAGGGKNMVPETMSALWKALRKTDWLWIGGGSMFHDIPRPLLRKYRSLLKMCLLTFLAKCAGKKIAWIGVGIGPVHTMPGRLLSRFCEKNVAFASLRDRTSWSRVNPGLNASSLIPDLALFKLAPVPPPEVKAVFHLGINVFPYFEIYENNAAKDGPWLEKLASNLVEVKRKCPVEVKFHLFSFSEKATENDSVALEKLGKMLGQTRIYSQSEYRELYSLCHGILSMRYHASLLSAYFGRATLAIAYHPKCFILDQIPEMRRTSFLTWPEQVKHESLIQTLLDMIEKPGEFSVTISQEELNRQFQQGAFPNHGRYTESGESKHGR
jgi:polysaccharide pyruvyl transferase WcaK-like protein